MTYEASAEQKHRHYLEQLAMPSQQRIGPDGRVMMPSVHKLQMDGPQRYNFFKGRQRADPYFGADLDHGNYSDQDRDAFEK